MTPIQLYNLLKALNLSDKFAKLLTAQIVQETGLKSNLLVNHNNPGGVMFINKGYQKNAVQGPPFPASETKGKPAFYATFKTLNDGLRDMVRITYPALTKSATPEAYADNLKAQGYFTGNLTIYKKNVRAAYDTLEKELKKKTKTQSGNLIQLGILYLLIIFTIYIIIKKSK